MTSEIFVRLYQNVIISEIQERHSKFMDSEKLVSVIVPVYNSAAHLEAALGSIIAQDYEDLEIILVNDSSTDDSKAIAQSVLETSGRTFRLIDPGGQITASG